jgi:hypothetical protein
MWFLAKSLRISLLNSITFVIVKAGDLEPNEYKQRQYWNSTSSSMNYPYKSEWTYRGLVSLKLYNPKMVGMRQWPGMEDAGWRERELEKEAWFQ